MLFDARAALAEILAQGAATPATPATDGPNVASVASVAVPQCKTVEGAHPSVPTPPHHGFPYGLGCGGRPHTWAGKVVSLEEWRRLTDWERHGSTGKVWNGRTRQWEPSTGGW